MGLVFHSYQQDIHIALLGGVVELVMYHHFRACQGESQ